MPFRDRVRKAFGRRSDSPKGNRPKVEYYRRGECPRSKYRGPVDPEHRRKLYNWNFAAATADRRRSFDLDLSPCTSLPDRPQLDDIASHVVDNDTTVLSETEPYDVHTAQVPRIQRISSESITVTHHEDAPSGSFDDNSDDSTLVVPSNGSSSRTLKDDWTATRRGAVSPMKQPQTPRFLGSQTPRFLGSSKRHISFEKRMPFDPQDLSSALSAIRIVS